MNWGQIFGLLPSTCSAAVGAIGLILAFRAGQRKTSQDNSDQRGQIRNHEGRLASIEREIDGLDVDRERLKTLAAEVTQLRTDYRGMEARTSAVERTSDRILEKIDGLDRVMRHDLSNIESKIDLLAGRLLPRQH
ncbi:MAG: DUF2730 family protein [Caulobacteraceae bacterium]